MRLIAHISDLHFGSEDLLIAEALRLELTALRPHLVVVSGDLTQRARPWQFRAARAWLDSLALPWLAVPGNHDVPLYDLFTRFVLPYDRFRRFITSDPMPIFSDDEVAVVGLNTARSLTWKGGRISHAQMAELRRRFDKLPRGIVKILVMHHHFVPPANASGHRHDPVGRADLALAVLEECGVDLVLAGHLHRGYHSDVTAFYPARRRSMIIAQAGTAISMRLRGEANAYNLIRIDQGLLSLAIHSWNGKEFIGAADAVFIKRSEGWVADPGRA
jgi:3',5'-cyclic AMP phosphodiesterase CpdA